MRRLICAYLCLLTASLPSPALANDGQSKASAKAKEQVVWQQSIAIQGATLGVRDKFGAKKKYTAKFVITLPKGQEVSATKNVTGDEFAYVNYPADFAGAEANQSPGEYHWKCLVDNTSVVHGTFRYTNSKDGYMNILQVTP